MRVVIAEDDVLLREGLVRLLAEAGLQVAAAAHDAPGLLAAVDRHRPDVVVTDIRMPPGLRDDGLRAALLIRARHPGTGVVVLSQFVQRRYARDLVGENPAGVGYLLKQRIADVERFCDDVRRVGEGGVALDPEVVSSMLGGAGNTGRPMAALTERQLEVLALVAEGRSNTSVADKLGISSKAVVQHVSNIYDVLGLTPSPDDHRRVLAVLRFLAG